MKLMMNIPDIDILKTTKNWVCENREKAPNWNTFDHGCEMNDISIKKSDFKEKICVNYNIEDISSF